MSEEPKDFLKLVFDTDELYLIDPVSASPQTSSGTNADAPSKEADASTVTPVAQEAAAAEIPPITGDVDSTVLLMVTEPAHEWLEPGDQAFLQEILKAIKLSYDQVALVNLQHVETKHFDWLRGKGFGKVVLFGDDARAGGMVPAGQRPYMTAGHQSATILCAEPLSAIRADRNKKVALWNALKELFLG